MRRQVASACCGALALISACSQDTNHRSEEVPSPLASDTSYRGICTTTASGADQVAPLGGQAVRDGWTSSPSGAWLVDTLRRAGLSDPLDVGSAFVLAHGVDGVAFLWLGPEDDLAGLALRDVDDDISTALLRPEHPHAAGGYRDAKALTTVAAGVRLWLLIHPRDVHERSNFGPLPSVVPCLPTDEALTTLLKDIAEEASLRPIDASIPATAGRFAINTDPGNERDDPSIQYLGRTQAEAVDLAWDSSNGTILLTTHIPPYETDPNILSNSEDPARGGPSGRVSAGGLDLLAVQPMAGQGVPTLNDEQRAALQALAASMNQRPFLGQS